MNVDLQVSGCRPILAGGVATDLANSQYGYHLICPSSRPTLIKLVSQVLGISIGLASARQLAVCLAERWLTISTARAS